MSDLINYNYLIKAKTELEANVAQSIYLSLCRQLQHRSDQTLISQAIWYQVVLRDCILQGLLPFSKKIARYFYTEFTLQNFKTQTAITYTFHLSRLPKRRHKYQYSANSQTI